MVNHELHDQVDWLLSGFWQRSGGMRYTTNKFWHVKEGNKNPAAGEGRGLPGEGKLRTEQHWSGYLEYWNQANLLVWPYWDLSKLSLQISFPWKYIETWH